MFKTVKDSYLNTGWDNFNNGYDISGEEVERLISVVPTKLQADFSDNEYYSFIHFGMNTFRGVEWGTGKESPKEFNPETLDTDQWARVLKESGSSGIILTAKHHDGFCLFPSKYTEHSIKNSPYKNGKGDVVKELSKSCKKYGLKFGIYLSPWDMHEKTYGTESYNDYFVNQLTELCTNYGDIFVFWFDGAKGEGWPDFNYDFERYYATIRKLQPNAAISVCGPDIRWIGNEGGVTRESEWSVVTKGSASISEIMKNSQHSESEADALKEVRYDAPDMGSRELVKNYRDLIWYPAEADVSIHHDWFYNDKSKMRTAKELSDIYFASVGGNAFLLLNVPPSKNGVIEEKDVKLLKDFKKNVDSAFKTKLSFDISVNGNTSDGLSRIKTDGSYMLKIGERAVKCGFKGEKNVATVVLREDIRHSQRIEEFKLIAETDKGLKCVYNGTVIGSKKIVRFKKPIKATAFYLLITQSRSNPYIRSIEIFE